MWHEDLLAWHQATPTVVTGVTGQGKGSLLSSAVVVAGGTGYQVGDLLQLVGGTTTSAALLTVETIGGAGDVLTVSVAGPGQYTVTPTNPVATDNQTNPGGTGATFTCTFALNPGGGIQLCQQDPARVYLSIAVADGNIAWFAPARMTDVNQGVQVGSFGCDGQLIFKVPADSILAKLAWYAWGTVDAQPFFVISVIYPVCPAPTWRDRVRTRPVQGSTTEFSHANEDTIRPGQQAQQGKQSVFHPNWDSIDETSGA